MIHRDINPVDHQHSSSGLQMATRSGVSLAEVLVSMLIMSIGVVSVASLFPISVLRTAQATQLTHAVFLRNNAEAWVESNSVILGNGQIPFPAAVNQNTSVFAVVDPLGFTMANNGLSNLNATTFAGPPSVNAVGSSVARTSGGVGTVALARQLATLPDSWSLIFEDVVTSFGALQITTNTDTTSKNVTPAKLNYRVVMFDVTGKVAVLKGLNAVAGTTLSWTSNLPVGFVPARARVEVQDLRYSYMLTVQKNPDSLATAKSLATINWVADVDVAVFFNRSFIASDENLFSLTYPVIVNSAAKTVSAGTLTPFNGNGFDGAPGVSGVDDDGDGNPDLNAEMGFLGSDDRRTVAVPFTVGLPGQPYLKKGSYMLELNALEWYRIVDLNTTLSPGTAVILLDREVRILNAANPVLGGVFMKGIIDVFPLASLNGQQ